MHSLSWLICFALVMSIHVSVKTQEITAEEVETSIRNVISKVVLGCVIAFYATSLTALGTSWHFSSEKSRDNLEKDLQAVGLLPSPVGRSSSPYQSIFKTFFENETLACFMELVCQLNRQYPNGVALDDILQPETSNNDAHEVDCPISSESCPDVQHMFQFWSTGISFGQYLQKMITGNLDLQ